jgi:sugar phosphate isomerase/epimerase
MKKRSIIALVLLMALTGLIFSGLYSCKKAPQKNIGLQLYSIRDSIKKDLPAAIKKVAEMGYKFVESADYGDVKFYDMEPGDFKALCEANGMTVLSSHTGRPLPGSENYEATMAWWDACIDAHVAVGAKYIVQSSMGISAYRTIDTLKKWCDYFNTVGEKCNAKGIRFGYHNHSRELSTAHGDTIVLDFMLQNTDPAKVMFQLDVYWCVVGGKNPVDYFNKYPGRFELWHIKDKKEIGESGMMDFPSIWAAAAVSGMKYGIVEVEEYNFDQFTSCKVSLDTLNAADYVVMPL